MYVQYIEFVKRSRIKMYACNKARLRVFSEIALLKHVDVHYSLSLVASLFLFNAWFIALCIKPCSHHSPSKEIKVMLDIL